MQGIPSHPLHVARNRPSCQGRQGRLGRHHARRVRDGHTRLAGCRLQEVCSLSLCLPSPPSVLFRSRPDIESILSVLQFVPRGCQAEGPRQLDVGRVCASLSSAFATTSTTHVLRSFVFHEDPFWTSRSGNPATLAYRQDTLRSGERRNVTIVAATDRAAVTRTLYRARSVALDRPSHLSCSVCVRGRKRRKVVVKSVFIGPDRGSESALAKLESAPVVLQYSSNESAIP